MGRGCPETCVQPALTTRTSSPAERWRPGRPSADGRSSPSPWPSGGSSVLLGGRPSLNARPVRLDDVLPCGAGEVAERSEVGGGSAEDPPPPFGVLPPSPTEGDVAIGRAGAFRPKTPLPPSGYSPRLRRRETSRVAERSEVGGGSAGRPPPRFGVLPGQAGGGVAGGRGEARSEGAVPDLVPYRPGTGRWHHGVLRYRGRSRCR